MVVLRVCVCVRACVRACCARVRVRFQVLSLVDRVVAKVDEASREGPDAGAAVGVAALLQVFRTLHDRFPEDYEAFKLEHVLFATLPRVLKLQCASWDPFVPPAAAAAGDADDDDEETAQKRKAAATLVRALSQLHTFLVTDRETSATDDDDDDADRGRFVPTVLFARAERAAVGKEIFDYAVTYAVVPKLRRAILSRRWDARRPSAFTATLARLWPLLTPALQASIASANLFPALRRSVQSWQPQPPRTLVTAAARSNNPPLHHWLPAWLPFIGEEMAEELWPGICHRLQKAFAHRRAEAGGGGGGGDDEEEQGEGQEQEPGSEAANNADNKWIWTVANGAALATVAPLRRLFPARVFAGLVQRAVLPLLCRDLRATEIDPANQSLAVPDAIWAWSPVLAAAEADASDGARNSASSSSASASASSYHSSSGSEALLLRALWAGEFFPRLRATLHAWLAQASTAQAFGEIEVWYKGWKAYFTKHAAALDEVGVAGGGGGDDDRGGGRLARQRRRNMEQMVDNEFKAWLAMIAARMQGDEALERLTPEDPADCSFERSLRALRRTANAARAGLAHVDASASSGRGSGQWSGYGLRQQSIGGRGGGGGSNMRVTMGGTVAADGEGRGVTFREVLEQLAAKEGVEFVPNFRRGRARASGKQIYDFGGVSCYIDRDVAFVLAPGSRLGGGGAGGGAKQQEEVWEPVSTAELLQRSREKQKRSSGVGPGTAGATSSSSADERRRRTGAPGVPPPAAAAAAAAADHPGGAAEGDGEEDDDVADID